MSESFILVRVMVDPKPGTLATKWLIIILLYLKLYLDLKSDSDGLNWKKWIILKEKNKKTQRQKKHP